MNNKTAQNRSTVIILAVFVVLLLLSNWWIRQQVGSIVEPEPAPEIVAQPEETVTVDEVSPDLSLVGEVSRRTRLVPGAEYTLSVFYVDGEEVARVKRSGTKVLEKTGTIPDGKVVFVNEYQNTWGEETYLDEKKHGYEVTYYKDGGLKSEAQYFYGDLMSETQYYPSGNVRFEVDYSDARNYENDSEVGIGKLYFPDGTLKYEWNITKSLKRGFKKSYNKDGSLRAATYFDEYGNIMNSR